MKEADRRLRAGIAEAYRHEFYREALLAELAAELARRGSRLGRREKLTTLCELSVETRARLRPVLRRLGGDPGDDAALRARGRQRAASLGRRRWIDFVDALLCDVAPGIARFEQFERWVSPSEAPELARATALQVAIRSFAELELRGRGSESLRPARALLGERGAPTFAAVAAG